MTPLLLTALLLAAAPPGAKVTSVTVFNDRARVVREARLELHGTARVELALLPDSVDPGSIRLEVSGAKGARAPEVKQVDLQHLDAEVFPEEAARKLLDQLDEADDRLALASRERKALKAQLESIEGLSPIAPLPDLRGPAPRLSATGWAQVLSFLSGSSERLRARLRDNAARVERLGREREKLAEEARELGAVKRRSGLQVIAQIAGEGTVRTTLTYLVGGARWQPSWELTYRDGTQPGGKGETVQAQLDGLVWQATGEEWTAADLTLSTAQPGQATALPELLSWRIGQKERFQPTSRATNAPPPLPPPPDAAPLDEEQSRAGEQREELRARLLARASRSGGDDDQELQSAIGEVSVPTAQGSLGGLANRPKPAAEKKSRPMPAAPPPPPPAPVAAAPKPASMRPMVGAPQAARGIEAKVASASPMSLDVLSSSESSYRSEPTEQIGIAPPPSWSPPRFAPDAPASLAGGFDLSFTAPNPETLESGSSSRRVPLFSESWPVQTERLVFPALASQAWLVAKLHVPAARTLPGGQAELFVGSDPAGEARLQAMAPGEELTLPLGIDRAIKPVRNVAQVQSEKGVFSKDDLDDYAVTIELANPYPRSIALRVFDQLPLKGDQLVDVELLQSQPAATPDKDTGQLEWAFQLGAGEKKQLTFSYRLRRPHGARLHQ